MNDFSFLIDGLFAAGKGEQMSGPAGAQWGGNHKKRWPVIGPSSSS
jgi:hypothetical protein